MGLHSTSIFSLDANVAGECGKLGLSMYAFPKFHHAAPARINRVMERPSKRASVLAHLPCFIPFHCESAFLSCSSLSLPLPLKGRGCDARDVAGSLSFGLTSRSPSSPSSLSLSLASSLARLLASISHSVIGGFPGPRYAPEIFFAQPQPHSCLQSKHQPAELFSSANFSWVSKTGFLQ